MRAVTRPLAFLILAGILGIACDSVGTNEGEGTVVLSGQVLERGTEQALSGAFVTIRPLGMRLETDQNGRYRSEVEVDSTMTLRLLAEKEGFSSGRATVTAVGGRTVEVPALRLERTVEETAESGSASNVILLEQTASQIGVKGSGGQEVAGLTFQVADSAGRPVVLDHAVEVDFQFGQRPGGGEFLHAEEKKTDNTGKVSVHLSSGTKAGVVQVVASAEVEGRTIRSKPVSVTIHGGLPDQAHFTVAPDQINFPGLTRYGLTNQVVAIVGDQYGNPVKPGTAVYFTTTHGVIEGSITTDDRGRGSVEITSANPLPEDGIAHVDATTADRGEGKVEGSTPIVFSGEPVIEVAPTTLSLGSWYDLTVVDPNGNPLAPETNITVTVEGSQVKAVGHTNVTLGQTTFSGGTEYEHVNRGEGITEFRFRAVEDPDPTVEGGPSLESIRIAVTGPNGSLALVIGGAGAKSVTKGASLEQLETGGVRVEASSEGR
jgi:hypothetical protein